MLRTLAIATAALTFAMTTPTGAQAAGGSIKGKVNLGSAAVETQSFTISKDPLVCGTGIREVPMVRANGGALLDAVVFLDKVKGAPPPPADLNKLQLTQEKCAFAPYMSIMANGGEMSALNNDPTLHNIHTYETIGRARRTVFNVSQPDKGNLISKPIKLRKGNGMKVECDAHDFMHAFVFVAKSAYFSQVNDKGEFEIKNVPPGKYTIKVWHGVLGEQKGKVEVTDSGATFDFSY